MVDAMDTSDNESSSTASESYDEGKLTNSSKEKCNIELRHLCAMNEHELEYRKLTTKEESEFAWKVDTNKPLINEEYVRNKTAEACSSLVSELFQLPIEKRSDVGVLVTLPKTCELTLPRELPAPKPKASTKWEEFAKQRGIEKQKKSGKVFDEATGEWAYRRGPNKVTSELDYPIIEVRKNDDPMEDPWERLRAEKKERVQKNTLSRIRNQERAGIVPKGTASKLQKQLVPAGVPVDLRNNKTDNAVSTQHRGKNIINQAMKAAQISTASLGKFDAMLEGEPDRKHPKRKFASTLISKSNKASDSEQNASLKLLERVMSTGSKKYKKDLKKGRLAKGETAYDYEYDDGLGPSSFHKKKGRAGAGKIKKVTKKRMK